MGCVGSKSTPKLKLEEIWLGNSFTHFKNGVEETVDFNFV